MPLTNPPQHRTFWFFGALAQLVERFNGIEEVSGSTPLCSIFRSNAKVGSIDQNLPRKRDHSRRLTKIITQWINSMRLTINAAT